MLIFFPLLPKNPFRKSAPKFLLDVYKKLNEEANGNGGGRYTRSADTDEGENFITDLDKVAIEQSDIITTFLNKSNYAKFMADLFNERIFVMIRLLFIGVYVVWILIGYSGELE